MFHIPDKVDAYVCITVHFAADRVGSADGLLEILRAGESALLGNYILDEWQSASDQHRMKYPGVALLLSLAATLHARPQMKNCWPPQSCTQTTMEATMLKETMLKETMLKETMLKETMVDLIMEESTMEQAIMEETTMKKATAVELTMKEETGGDNGSNGGRSSNGSDGSNGSNGSNGGTNSRDEKTLICPLGFSVFSSCTGTHCKVACGNGKQVSQ